MIFEAVSWAASAIATPPIPIPASRVLTLKPNSLIAIKAPTIYITIFNVLQIVI